MKKATNIIKKAFQTLGDCIVKVLPIMIGSGMIKVVLIVVGPYVLNILSETAPTYKILTFVAEAGYYFMPIYIGYAAGEIFNTNKYLGALIGGMLLSPTYVEMVKNSESLTFLRVPVTLTDYGNQILPAIIAVWIMSYIYKFLDKNILDSVKAMLTPLFTVLIMIPIVFCAIGPLGVFLGNKLIELIMLLKDIGPIGNGIMSALLPIICIVGLAGANVSSMILLAATGCDPILLFANIIYNDVLGFVTLALYLRNKNSDVLAEAFTSTIAGTSEPALFHTVMKDPKAILCVMIGDFVGGVYAGLMGVKTFALTSFGVFGLAATIGPDSSIVHATIALVLGCVVGFVLCLITHPKKKSNI